MNLKSCYYLKEYYQLLIYNNFIETNIKIARKSVSATVSITAGRQVITISFLLFFTFNTYKMSWQKKYHFIPTSMEKELENSSLLLSLDVDRFVVLILLYDTLEIRNKTNRFAIR